MIKTLSYMALGSTLLLSSMTTMADDHDHHDHHGHGHYHEVDNELLKRNIENSCESINIVSDDLLFLPYNSQITETSIDSNIKEKLIDMSKKASDRYLKEIRRPMLTIDSLIGNNQADPHAKEYAEAPVCDNYHFIKDHFQAGSNNVPKNPDASLMKERCNQVTKSREKLYKKLVKSPTRYSSLSLDYFSYMQYINRYQSVATRRGECDAINIDTL